MDENHNILLKHVHNTTSSEILVDASKVTKEDGTQLHWSGWSLSADMKYVLFQADYLRQWRHSSHANYYIHRLSDSVTVPVTRPSSPPVIAKCIWAPVGHALAFISSNDLFVIPESSMDSGEPSEGAIQVTTDGSEVVFNGVPDWVYEEEVFASDHTTWWSPDASTIAYLRMNESEVKDYRLQFYNPSNDAFEPHQYTTEIDMK